MRNLTVEYLRVVFISFIVLLHILWINYGGLRVALNDNTPNTYIQLGLTNLVSLGVTGFILISGYYGVKLKVNRIMSLWMQTTIYALLSVVAIWVFGGDCAKTSVWQSEFLQSGGGIFKGLIDASLSLFDGWWFVADYVILMLMSPFLNAGLERISRKALMFIILMLSFMMYGVWWFHAKDGSMPLLLFFNTYLVGRYIRLYPVLWLEKYKYLIFFLGLLILVLEPMALHSVGLDNKMKFVGGNFNVLVLVVDIALLLICNAYQKMGKGNIFTRNVLAVYLIHESGIGNRVLHKQLFHEGVEFNIAYILCVVMAVVVVCIIIEEIRKQLFNKLESWAVTKVDSLLKVSFEK